VEIKVMDKVLAANDAWAAENRKLLKEKNIKMLNVIGSPGAGKTALLERTIDALEGKIKIGVIEGDIATAKDAQRIQKKGAPVYQINTGTACHLDANLVNVAIKEICKEQTLQLIIVENIGNLVCPAEFDIGEDAKIAVLSVAEGDDKVEKYPLLFSEAGALVVSKLGLLKHTNFDLDYVTAAYGKLNRKALYFPLDSLTGQGFDPWIDFVVRSSPDSL
jgi:hydrogenase nickel incorporation protein HypB